MPSVKAANLGRKLRRLPAFGVQIGMTLDAELVSYSGQCLVVASVLPVARGTVRGERFARLMHQTSVASSTCGRCGHAPGISVALRAVMSNESVCRCTSLGPGWSKRAILFFPSGRSPSNSKTIIPPTTNPSPHHVKRFREQTLSQSVV
jgi:hypothetical protein